MIITPSAPRDHRESEKQGRGERNDRNKGDTLHFSAALLSSGGTTWTHGISHTDLGTLLVFSILW